MVRTDYCEMDVAAGVPLRVQDLAQKGIGHVPSEYIQPPENRPVTQNPLTNDPSSGNPSTDADIPVIDLFGFDPDRRVAVREVIRRACAEWGAFHVTNHGIPISLLDDVRRVGLTFFNQCSMEEKLRYACDSTSAASEGYGSRMLLSSDYDQNQDGPAQVLDWRDYFDHHTLPISRRNPSRWPHFPSDYRQVVEKYSNEMKTLAHKLLGLISESLGLTTSSIEDAVRDFYQNITISYYPPCPQPDLTLGLQSHSDMGALTLLIQDDVGGLQVLKDGVNWVTVKPLSHAILVILADQTEIITNGKYKSAVHRAVTNSTRARLSVATFHDPAKSVKISAAPELVTDSSPLKYRDIVYGDYVLSWYTKGPEGKRNIDALRVDS